MAYFSECQTFKLPVPYADWGTHDVQLCVTEKTYDVDVSLRVFYDMAYYDWEMYLQRYNGSSWDTVGSRSGYVSYGSPSHRTFTNVGKTGAKMKVYVKFWFSTGEYVGAEQSGYFYR